MDKTTTEYFSIVVPWMFAFLLQIIRVMLSTFPPSLLLLTCSVVTSFVSDYACVPYSNTGNTRISITSLLILILMNLSSEINFRLQNFFFGSATVFSSPKKKVNANFSWETAFEEMILRPKIFRDWKYFKEHCFLKNDLSAKTFLINIFQGNCFWGNGFCDQKNFRLHLQKKCNCYNHHNLW